MVKAIFGSLIGMLLFILVLFGNMLINSDDQFASDKLDRVPEYHIQVIVQNSNENFWNNLKLGASAAAEEQNVFVEFVPVAQNDASTINTAVEKGIYANVDGIALQATATDTVNMIKTLTEEGKQIAAFENYYYDFKNIPQLPVIGSNNYDIGYYAGDMTVEATVGKKKKKDGKYEVGLILNDANNQDNEVKNNSIVQGILQAFVLYKDDINLSADHIYPMDTGIFDQEKLNSLILPDAKNLDVIICTDEKITPSVAQLLLDKDMTKDITIIGFGDKDQTLNFVKRGVIYGAVCPDSYKIGYYTVQQLVKKIKGETISYSKLIDLKEINADNVEQYISEE